MTTTAWRSGFLSVACVLALACDGSSKQPDDGKPPAPTRDGGAGDGDGDGDGPPVPGKDGGAPGDPDGSTPEPPESKKVDLLTRSYNRQRTGANLKETVLHTDNVRSEEFGKLFELDVDDQVYAQILYVSDLAIAGGTHDVIYVATVNNTVYAFDAHTPGAPLWQRNFNGTGRPTRNSEVGQNCQPFRDFSGNIGIVGTPVIDRASSSMYFVTRTVTGAQHRQTLHAIDIVTGKDKLPGARDITATAAGTGAGAVPVGSADGAVQGKLTFDPRIENQRMSVGLSEGVLYLGWAGFCDTGDYHGWAMAYDAATLEQKAVLNTTPDGWAGGFWQAGAAPVFDDDGNLFLATGNGDYDGAKNLGQTVLKLAKNTLKPLDHFAPSNFGDLNIEDWDLGSAGPTWLPGTSQIVLGGKEGKLYLLDMNNLGELATGDTQIPQSFQVVDPMVRPGSTHHLHNTVVVWESPEGLNMYVAGENDFLHAYRYDRDTKRFKLPAVAQSEVLPPLGMPGGMITVSADGSKAGTGIVWVTTPRTGDANQNVTPGILRAYHAETLALLWDSSSAADDTYNFAKFNNPTVANGKVYVASFSNKVSVFGLRSDKPAAPVNLTGNASASGSPPCAPDETAARVVDGKVYRQDDGDKYKWCSSADNANVVVDLGAVLSVGRVIVRHAGAGGETIDYNTRAFTLEVGATLGTLETVATVTNNTQSSTTHDFAEKQVRFVQLTVATPTQNGNGSTRIYEIEVYGP
jgi:hypothetical protein